MKKNVIMITSMVLMLSSSFSNAAVLPKKDFSKKPVVTVVKSDLKVKRVADSYLVAALTKNLEYDFAKISVRKRYDDKLDQLAKLMIDNKYAVALRGHADSVGSFKANWVVSDKRANSVKDYLVSKGVPANKIVATAFGSTKPIASNKTITGRQKNRRVEIKLNETNEN